jgi:hypothetical protein
MKLKKLSSAIGVACVAMASQSAFATAASVYTTANTASVYFSGATAQDNGILTFALQQCVVGSLHRYTWGSDAAVYYCEPKSSLLNVGKTYLALHKYSKGGSGKGVSEVATGTALPFLDLTKINATNCQSSTVNSAATFGTLTATYVNVACSTNGVYTNISENVVPVVGLSDVEPAFFDSPATTSALTQEAISTLIFGVPVSRKLYLGLQDQQGLRTGSCTNTASTFVSTDTNNVTSSVTQIWEQSESCMPSMSHSQLISLFTVNGILWSEVGVTGTVANPVTGGAYIVRRTNSSGTQKTFEALVARSPNTESAFKSCNADVVSNQNTRAFRVPSVAADASGAGTGSLATQCSTAPSIVTAFDSGSKVTACLGAHDTGNRYAIGMQTMETIATPSATFRYVKVDGATPNHAGVASGRYLFWTVPTINYLASNVTSVAVTGTATTAPVTSADVYGNVLAQVKYELRDPVGLAIQQPFGPSGLMALYRLQSPLPARDFTGASSINPWDKNISSTVISNCQMPKSAGKN